MKGIKEETYTLEGLDKTQILLIRDGLELLIDKETYHPDTSEKLNELQHEVINLMEAE